MATAQLEAPLIFLTTSSASVPKGRNARAHARSESAKRTNPVTARQGTFGTFSVGDNVVYEGDENVHRRKRQKTTSSSLFRALHASATLDPPLKILATHFQRSRSLLPPNVDLDDVLKVAAFHIRRRSAHIVHAFPERTLDALRCRQWCSVSAPFASIGRSAFLDSAIASVVSKVHQVISGGRAEGHMLASYAEALHALRRAVLRPDLHDQTDMLATTQLLAVYEMLDFPETGSWAQHMAGAAALTKLQELQDSGMGKAGLPAGSLFVEALLSNDDSFFDGPRWKAFLNVLNSKPANDTDLAGEKVSCFTALRSVFRDYHAAMANGSLNGWPARLPLLSRAHELRSRIKSLVIQNEERLTELKKCSKTIDILGLFLVSVMMLDKLIMALRQDPFHRGIDLEEDTQGLCSQMVRMELAASEYHPGKELLLALQRQISYPSLSYEA